MKRILIVLTIFISTTIFAQNGEKNFIDQNFIEVKGKSEMKIIPDKIYIKVIIDEKDNKNKTSIPELENVMIMKLKEIGIDISKNLYIKDISSNFKFYLLAKSKILLSKEYQILVDNGKDASQVFIELESIGISNVSIEKLENSKIEQYRREVKIDAIKAAKEKAEALANAIGQSIGKAIYIEELDNNASGYAPGSSNSIRIRGSSSIYGSRAESPIMDYEFEEINIEYSILCRFELK